MSPTLRVALRAPRQPGCACNAPSVVMRWSSLALCALVLAACRNNGHAASNAGARSASHGPPSLDVRALGEDAVRYRLVPDSGSERDTTTWTVTRRAEPGPRGLALQVMTSVSRGDTVVDSVVFDARTLIPLWEHAHGRESFAVRFTRTLITGWLEEAGSPGRTLSATAPGFAYSATMDNVVVRSLPLAPGYQTVLPFWDGDRLELDTVRVRPLGVSDTGAWVVDFAEPYAVETLWIDRATRRVMRHEYAYARDGSRFHVLTER